MVGSRTFKEDIKRFIAKTRGKKDPFQIVGAENDRTKSDNDDFVWALKDINFEVKQGEIVGVIGRNGAGKSTLLKLLSKVTKPTTGSIKVKGRIASLLEVGTGFHPELTGRENIFLNGAILGMSKAEIRSKLDEIVDFAGIEKYLDTPTKRYSSGMTVRLGFAVAAHLEPDILIVDEVLAVGDAEFQKKALGKIKNISAGEGRTILFVSHNMASIKSICNRAILMNQGKINLDGNVSNTIAEYLKINLNQKQGLETKIEANLSLHNNGHAKFIKCELFDIKNNLNNQFGFMDPFRIIITLNCFKDINGCILSIFVLNSFGEKIIYFINSRKFESIDLDVGKTDIKVMVNEDLIPGDYSLGFSLGYKSNGETIDCIEHFYPFTVTKESQSGKIIYPWNNVHGYLLSNEKVRIINGNT